MPFYEDFEVGQEFVSPSRTITDGMATVLIDVGGFTAAQFNSEIEAQRTPLGWRAIPARLVFALMGGLVERMTVFAKEGPGIFVGADKLIFKSPLKVGDTIHLEWKVIEMRKTSNPKWGLVDHKETLKNQHNDIVCTAEITHLFEYRRKG